MSHILSIRRLHRLTHAGLAGILGLLALLAGTAPAHGGQGEAQPSPAATAPQPTPPSPPARPTPAKPTPPRLFDRWIDLQAVTGSVRYRWIETSAGVETSNGLQWQEQIRARVKFDAKGRYSLHLGLFTGTSFTSGWDATGVGTGEGTAQMFLKQLFGSAEPVRGLEIQYGSLYPSRGQHTEMTSLDNDAYVSGGRVRLRRPQDVFFDEIAVTIAAVSHLRTPNVFRRLEAFEDANYRQVLVMRRVGKRLAFSTDYTGFEGQGQLRQAARVTLDTAALDAVRVEYGVRVDDAPHDTAFAAVLEKTLGRLEVQGGYVHADPSFGLFAGDRYGPGNRVFTLVSLPIGWDLTLSVFAQKQLDPPANAPNDKRGEIVLQWNALETIRRAW
jgi:hypothetical protein